MQSSDFNHGISNERFTYFRCAKCGLCFLQPVPEDIGKYYRLDYYAIPENIEQLAVLSSKQKHKLEAVQKFMANGRLLEIGSSYGDFAYLAKVAGYDVSAIEMDEQCCQFLRTQVGIEAINSDDPINTLKTLGKYDIIALWQVIEHLPSPWKTLELLVEHLSPNGLLVMAAPNPNALQFRLFGAHWTHLDAPRHLQLIPISVLKEYLHKLGMVPVLVTTSDAESLKANTYGWKKSIMNLLGVRVSNVPTSDVPTLITLKPSRVSLKFLVSRAAIRILVGAIELLLSPLEHTGLRGCSYTVIFQKIS